MGHLEAGRPPAALLELVVPPRQAGTYRLAKMRLRGQPAGAATDQEVCAQDIVVRYTERPSEARETAPRLMTAIQAVSAFKLQSQAIEEAGRGNVAGATRRLRAERSIGKKLPASSGCSIVRIRVGG